MFSLRNKKDYLRIIINTPSYLEPCNTMYIQLFGGGGPVQNNHQNLDLSYKMDLEFWDSFGWENTVNTTGSLDI